MSDTGTQPPVHVPSQKGGGLGCWLVGVITAFLVFILVLVGLFLPPVNLLDRLFGEEFVVLNATNNGALSADQAFSVAVAPTDPGQNFGVRVETVSLRDFESANASAGEWIPELKNSAPINHALQSAVYSIYKDGVAPLSVTLSVQIPANVAGTDLLDLYGWYNSARRWRFIPSQPQGNQMVATVTEVPDHVALFQAAPPSPTVVIAYDLTQVLPENVGSLATIVLPSGQQPTLTGQLTGTPLAPGFTDTAGYMVMPVIRNYEDPRALDPETVEAIIGNAKLRGEHVSHIIAFARDERYDGIFIDYRGIAPELRENYSAFIRELDAGLNNIGKLLGVIVPSATIVDSSWNTGAYDWRSLGASADYVKINLDVNPTVYQNGETQPIDAMLSWAVGEISRERIVLGLSALSIREIAGTLTKIGYDEAIAGLGDVTYDAVTSETGSVEPGTEIRARLDGMSVLSGIDTFVKTPYLDYLNPDESVSARVWLTTGEALRFRMDKTIPFALGGVGFEDLLAKDLADNVLDSIISYKTQLPGAPSPSELALQWRIESVDGLLIEETTNLNEELVVTLTAPDGNYAINVAVVGVGQQVESLRAGAEVALFRPTATPTPVPTATPTPTPSPTPTLPPVVPTNPPAPGSGGGSAPTGGGQSAFRPGAGSIAAGFEYGGHVTGAGSGRAAGAMRRAGMTWMKVQVRYYPGTGADVAAGEIQAAHAAGFKILVGTVGNPNDLAARGDGYVNDYVNWLAGIAGLGADAIEVWNEPNLAREWPEGKISGSSYASMLAKAYAAIKSRNGSTMVISGAPAPTGAEAAFPGRVMNDDRFLREMVAAGALNSLDCVGAHYNEGIIAPSAQGGDPRDNYYTRYFWGMVNTYNSITGGAKPICFTELGYLTSEGYPPLPSFFSWAQNVTVGQQAAWLAEAAALSSSTNVRLMIVWNVDFTSYTSDPQGGYAMIRPDGSCPACDALAGAR